MTGMWNACQGLWGSCARRKNASVLCVCDPTVLSVSHVGKGQLT